MLSYLDDECLRPGEATDETLLQKFNQRCLDHAHYESRASKHLLSNRSLQNDQFRLIHYAGKVGHTSMWYSYILYGGICSLYAKHPWDNLTLTQSLLLQLATVLPHLGMDLDQQIRHPWDNLT